MNDYEYAWAIIRHLDQTTSASTPQAKAVLKWAREKRAFLRLESASKSPALSWRSLMTHVNTVPPAQELESIVSLQCAQLAKLVKLDTFNARLLTVIALLDRAQPLQALSDILQMHNLDMLALVGVLANGGGHDAGRHVQQSDIMRLGLARISAGKSGGACIQPSHSLSSVFDRAAMDPDIIAEILMGRLQQASLSSSDFSHANDALFFIEKLLRGATAARAAGINILIYGPPGTGKTELAKTLAAVVGAQIFSVAEADEYGEEPSRWDRVTAYRLAQRVAQQRENTLLLFDEMEDMIGSARPMQGGYVSNREGSKVYINRLLETNPVPTLWTTNALANVDPAIVRRMSYVLKLDHPTPKVADAILARMAADEDIALHGNDLRTLNRHTKESTSVMRAALRASRLAGAGEAGACDAASSLLQALHGGKPLRLSQQSSQDIMPSLYETDQDMGSLLKRLTRAGAPSDFSLLLTGPPGTGKTAFAHHLAEHLERPLLVKRASDLMSKWVGETEQQIAEAFREALSKDAVLLFDEVDSLLADRTQAQRSWEVSQVNELLSWFDTHPLPFIAATNHATRLDAAALRRFVFKLDFRPLTPQKAGIAFKHYFGLAPTAALARLEGLTPGDFAVVSRQLKYMHEPPSPEFIVERLAAEVMCKPMCNGRIGF